MQPFVVWLDQVSKDDLLLVGGKGANLGEMIKLGLPVPLGFAVTTFAFDKFLESNGLDVKIWKMIKECDVENTQELLQVSNKIKQMILASDIPAPIKNSIIDAYNKLSYTFLKIPEKIASLVKMRGPTLVAVRSSATAEDLPTASFAGQQATFLNVKGETQLIEAIKKCWASLFEPRAIYYRAKNNISKASISVIVQKMVNSDASGVMFTVDPVTGEDFIVIEATWGLGETLVGGEVEPDFYKVDKNSYDIVEKKIGRKEIMRIRDYKSDSTIVVQVPDELVEKQVLKEEQIKELAKYGVILEKHYKRPQDIEFAVERGKVYIVQTRAITAVGKKEEVKIEGKVLLKGIPASPGIATGKVKIVHGLQDITKVEPGDILVTKMTSPDLVPTMSKAAAIVTDEGGRTSHAAIVSREMGIPCVVGTKEATKILKDGMLITVDAYNGIIYEGKQEIEVKQEKFEAIETKTKVKVNLVFAPKNIEEIAKAADGVGLLRIEHMITQFGVHPAKLIKEGRTQEYVDLLVRGIEPIAKAFHPKPVWVRTLDARTDEFRNLEGGQEEPHEANPMLGWHGIRRSLDEPELLKAEFLAVKKLHEKGYDNVEVMLPFVINVEEFEKAKEIAREVGYDGKLGIMVETPAAALNIEEFCKAGISFASIGSNDLTMLTLGIDRNNEKIASLYYELHPAVLKLISNVIKVCNKYGVESSICGEAPSNYPEMIEFLVKEGIGSISVNIDALQRVKKQVKELEAKQESSV